MLRTLATFAVLLLCVFIATPAYAEGPSEPGQRGGRGGRGGGNGNGGRRQRRRPTVEQVFERFDKNTDGVLTEDEVPGDLWARIAEADTDGNGVSAAELQAFREQRRGECDKGDDGDGDGKRRRRRGGRGGQGGGSGGGSGS